MAACAALTVLAAAAAWYSHDRTAAITGTDAVRNVALTDTGATTEVIGQINDAVQTVYSYDYTKLDTNQQAARAVITGAFPAKFDQVFTEVRNQAPTQKIIVSATVSASAVRTLTPDHAVLLVFLDQQGVRGDTGQPVAAAGRLTVTADKVDNRWKISDIQAR